MVFERSVCYDCASLRAKGAGSSGQLIGRAARSTDWGVVSSMIRKIDGSWQEINWGEIAEAALRERSEFNGPLAGRARSKADPSSRVQGDGLNCTKQGVAWISCSII
mmetsp:Transcript_54205/g.115171  ORF Transcript_54205/g.115171 Transcript_54205/m.115171 type:complete len:107 (-) Transcript_54205:74-394(-)